MREVEFLISSQYSDEYYALDIFWIFLFRAPSHKNVRKVRRFDN